MQMINSKPEQFMALVCRELGGQFGEIRKNVSYRGALLVFVNFNIKDNFESLPRSDRRSGVRQK